MRVVRLPAFAKVNLCLHVLGRRADGYHELRTVFQAISLHDTLELELLRQPRILISADDPTLPTGRENLIWRALAGLRRELGIRCGVRVHLTKRIPLARGLGGGSSDAATAMIGLLRLVRKKPRKSRLLDWAARLGADVPFFLVGGRALGVGRGDKVYALRDGPRRAVLVVSPRHAAVSTPAAYRWLGQLTNRSTARKLWCFCALCWSPREAGTANAFEPVVFRRYPRLATIKRALLRAGAAEAALAGSGSAVFALFPHPARARRAAQKFPQDHVIIARTLSRDEYQSALWGGLRMAP